MRSWKPMWKRGCIAGTMKDAKKSGNGKAARNASVVEPVMHDAFRAMGIATAKS